MNDVVDKIAIADLIALYTIVGDRGRFEEFVNLFLEEGTLALPLWEATGRTAIMKALAGGEKRLFKDRAPRIMRHHLTTSLIQLKARDHATARTYFLNFSDIGPDHSGVYVDEIKKAAKGWRFARRDVRIDWQADHSLYLPLLSQQRQT
jgi:hypothetical protein